MPNSLSVQRFFRGLSLDILGKELGLSASRISRIERGLAPDNRRNREAVEKIRSFFCLPEGVLKLRPARKRGRRASC